MTSPGIEIPYRYPIMRSAKRLATPINKTKLNVALAVLGWLFLTRTVCGADLGLLGRER
jgi:hypothetical protein